MEVMFFDIFLDLSVLAATVGRRTSIKKGANYGSFSYVD